MYSNGLQRLDLQIVHYDSSPGNSRQGDIPSSTKRKFYYVIIQNVVLICNGNMFITFCACRDTPPHIIRFLSIQKKHHHHYLGRQYQQLG